METDKYPHEIDSNMRPSTSAKENEELGTAEDIFVDRLARILIKQAREEDTNVNHD